MKTVKKNKIWAITSKEVHSIMLNIADKNETVSANQWVAAEKSATNAYNLNASGSFNNNNKNNTNNNAVRAVFISGISYYITKRYYVIHIR